MRPPASADSPVWGNPPFLRLWTAQALTQTAQNAIWYALLVIVEEATQSTTHLGITILAVIVPSILLGVPAGAYVDRWDKRVVLIVTNLTRALVVLGYIVFSATLGLLYTVAFVFSVISQFFAPAETAMIPAVVSRRRLMQANSFFTLTFNASQLLGLVFFGPLLVKLAGTTPFFIAMSLLYVGSGILVLRLPPQPVTRAFGSRVHPIAELTKQLREVWDLLMADRQMRGAMGYLTLGGALTLVVAMLAPRFTVDVLGIAANDAVFVLAPAGVGMLAAAFVLSRTTAGPLADRRRVITAGLVLVSVSLGVAASLPALGRAVGLLGPEGQEIGVMGTAHLGLVGGIMVSTLAAGVGFASIVVAAQTLLQERAPIRARGRVFAVQLTMGNLLAVIPLLSIGGLADLVGVNRVLIVLAVAVLLVAVLSRRDWEREDEPVDNSEVASPPGAPGR